MLKANGIFRKNGTSHLSATPKTSHSHLPCILDRYDGTDYNPKEFYFDMLAYGGHGINISRAIDYGTENDVKRELCNYIENNEYNSKIKDFINKANWLIADTGFEWSNVFLI